MKHLLLPLLTAMVTALLTSACSTTRAGYETAPYHAVHASGEFEVRDYPALTLAETPMTSEEDSSGFGRLFRFISGRNQGEQKIAMTTPVFVSGTKHDRTMAFVLPTSVQREGVPQPLDKEVAIRELPPGRFAVLRFSGRRNAGNATAALARLQGWMTAEGLPALSPPLFAYFDPPWTPPFLRRNEVLIRTEATFNHPSPAASPSSPSS